MPKCHSVHRNVNMEMDLGNFCDSARRFPHASGVAYTSILYDSHKGGKWFHLCQTPGFCLQWADDFFCLSVSTRFHTLGAVVSNRPAWPSVWFWSVFHQEGWIEVRSVSWSCMSHSAGIAFDAFTTMHLLNNHPSMKWKQPHRCKLLKA